jgi:ribosome modulation factor
MLTLAYEKGRHAAFDGKPEHANPYRRVNGRAHRQWLQGHRDARQELGGVLVRFARVR